MSLIFIAFVLLILSGCAEDEKLNAFFNTNLANYMSARIVANKNIVNTLYTSGLLSESEKNTIEKNLDRLLEMYTNEIFKNKDLQKKVMSAIVDWQAPRWEDYKPIKTETVTGSDGNTYSRQVNGLGYTKEEWESKMITTYIANNKKILNQMNISLFKGKGAKIEPIQLIDSETADIINKKFGYKVYVLKPFSQLEDEYGLQSLDEIIEMIKAAVKDKDKVDNSVLDRFFMPAKDENGNDITLLDISKRGYQVVADSTGSPLVSNAEYQLEGGTLKKVKAGNEVIAKNKISPTRTTFSTPNTEPGPGKDMVVMDVDRNFPLFAVRFHEFNKEAVDNVIKALGMNPDKFVFTTYNKENRVYIMEYPVYYVKTLKNKADNKNEFEAEFEKSNMGINLRTGKLIKYGTAWGDDTAPGVVMEDNDPYLTIAGAKNNQEAGKSAFVIEGEIPDDYVLTLGDRQIKLKTGRIILRDYLEAVYAPGVVEGENMVVFGRKIRFLKFNGSKDEDVAIYVDKQGNTLEGTPRLKINDFADFASLNESNPEVRYIGLAGEHADGTSVAIGSDDSSRSTPLGKLEELKRYTVDSINPTEQFPGLKIGRVDYDSTNKPLFYAIAVKNNMFESALFSGWINNRDIEKNSLDWWLSWLSNPNRSYHYTINKNVLEDFLARNYTFELQEAGIIILDLKTISKIQKEYDIMKNYERTRAFRTTFVIMGYAIICYAFILMMAWVLDTNVDLGFNVLERVSFGHWVAIKDIEELPEFDNEDKKYVTFQNLVFKVFGIAVIGVVLIFVNVIDLVVNLINIFGGIAKLLSYLITGS
jgi:hypothetical protein